FEGALGHHDCELAFERDRQLDEIERIGGQVVTEGHLGGEILQPYAQLLGDQMAKMRFHELIHAHRPLPRHQVLRCPNRRPESESPTRTGAGATAGEAGAAGGAGRATSVPRRLPTGSQPSRPEPVARTWYRVEPAQPGRHARIATSVPSLRLARALLP